MAEEIKKGIAAADASIEVGLFPISELTSYHEENINFVNDSAAVIVGTPDYYAAEANQLKTWLDNCPCKLADKLCGAYATANFLQGGGDIAIPESVKDDVYDLGFVSKQDKYNAMAAASLLCQPSHNESFSLVIMESWLCGRPVLVSSQCAVTKDFAKRSNGGLYFKDYFEFEGCVEYILEHPEAAAELGANGGAFVRENFERDIIVEKYRTFFQKLMGA